MHGLPILARPHNDEGGSKRCDMLQTSMHRYTWMMKSPSKIRNCVHMTWHGMDLHAIYETGLGQ